MFSFHCSRCRLIVGSKRDEGMSFYVLTYASHGRACSIEKQTVARSGLSLVQSLSIQPKLSKIWKSGKWYRKMSGNVPRNSGNYWISEMWTIQPKILDFPAAKSNRNENSPEEIFANLGITCELALFWKIWKMIVHLLLQVAENLNWTICLNGKRPTPRRVYVRTSTPFIQGDVECHI